MREHHFGGSEFDEFAEIHISGKVGNTGGLLHAVGDDDNRVFFFQLIDQIFDLGCGDRIQGRARAATLLV